MRYLDLPIETEFGHTCYDSLLWKLDRPLELLTQDSDTHMPQSTTKSGSSSMFQSGIYLFALLSFIITSTPIYFTELDCHECLAENLALWICTNNGKLPF